MRISAKVQHHGSVLWSMTEGIDPVDHNELLALGETIKPQSGTFVRSDKMPSSRPAPMRVPRVLVVDAKVHNLRAVCQLLDVDYELKPALSLERAVRLLSSFAPDLVLLSTRMTGSDGVELCRRMRRHAALRDIPVILMSDSPSAEEETAGLLAGAVDFVAKPVNPDVLRARVSTHLKLKHQADLLREQAHLDALTSLANRRRFDQQFDLEWRACLRDDCPLGLILLDVDYFKQFNDFYGHQKGDDVLRKVAQVLNLSLRRPRDFVARFGGEEFVCLMPGDDCEATARAAQYLLDSLLSEELPHQCSPVSPFVTMSAGVAALVPSKALSKDDLLRQADARLYHAKTKGRARVMSSMSAEMPSGLKLVTG